LKPFLVLLTLGLLALMLQGTAALMVPASFVPDLGLLVVVAAAIHLRSVATGVLLAVVLGYATDMLSASLLGEHALLRLATYGAARFASARLNLRGPLPQALFVAILCVAYALGLWGLVAAFTPELGTPLVMAGSLLPYALVNGFVAPFTTHGVGALLTRLGDDEGGNRVVRLEPRSFSA
jgi:rod shape-determining protein MreD